MLRWLVMAGVLCALGCTSARPTSFDDATRPLAPASEQSSPVAPAAGVRCDFDAECPKDQRCQEVSSAQVPAGVCTSAS